MSFEDDAGITFIKGGDTRKATLHPDEMASQEEPLGIARAQTLAA